MLLAKVDDLTRRIADLVAEVREVTEQLEPGRAQSCRNAITMASVMVDEIRLRAHARPLDSDEQPRRARSTSPPPASVRGGVACCLPAAAGVSP